MLIPKKKKLLGLRTLRACLDAMKTEWYHSIFMIHHPNQVGPTVHDRSTEPGLNLHRRVYWALSPCPYLSLPLPGAIYISQVQYIYLSLPLHFPCPWSILGFLLDVKWGFWITEFLNISLSLSIFHVPEFFFFFWFLDLVISYKCFVVSSNLTRVSKASRDMSFGTHSWISVFLLG